MRPNLNVRKIGPPPEPVNQTAKAAVTRPVVDEETLRAQLGVEAPKKKFKLPDTYRTILNLDPQDIIDFFNAVIDHRDEFVQVDFVVPSSMLEHRIARLKRVIAASRAVIEGMAVNIIKIRRGKDDPLLDDKTIRDKYKRDENARIARCNAKLFQYREALRTGKNLHQKIWRTVTKPVYFHDEVDDSVTFRTVTDVRWFETEKLYTGRLQTHSRVELLQCFRFGRVDLAAYRAVMSLGDAALAELGETEAEQRERWDYVRQWENLIIVSAVRHGVITPRRDLAELLGLGSVLDENDLGYTGTSEIENKLAIKTGGACYGGRIRGEGGRRKLNSFDKPLRDQRDGGQYHDLGSQSLRDLSDDAEAYDPR